MSPDTLVALQKQKLDAIHHWKTKTKFILFMVNIFYVQSSSRTMN